MRWFACLLSCFLWAAALSAWADDRPRWTMLVDVGGREIEGMPLAWSSKQVYVLARDGRLWDFAPGAAQKFRKTSSSFTSYSAIEVRSQLEREFSGRLQVTSVGHYFVAHPAGKEAWAERFEDLYRSIVHYFGVHGFHVHEPQFPLVAVVWGSREDFVRHSASDGNRIPAGVLGFYSPITNRVTLYDQGSGTNNKRMWQQNDATIIHEATHQMAFNTGVHNRFGPTPRWIAEGLGTMFEAPGVWDWRSYPQQSDRVNRSRLAQFRHWLTKGRTSGAFVNLLGSDRQFDTNPSAAYAESWAWIFFLTEMYPQKFGEYLERVASKPNFQAYGLARRMSDFTSIFGDDLRLLERHFLTFIASL